MNQIDYFHNKKTAGFTLDTYLLNPTVQNKAIFFFDNIDEKITLDLKEIFP